jgi:hypothetical protein
MSTKDKQTTKGRASKQEHRRIAHLLSFELFTEPESERSAEIIQIVSNLGAAVGDFEKYDLRPEYLIAYLLDSYKACGFKLEGQDKPKADEAYNALLKLAAEIDAEDNPAEDEARDERHRLALLAAPEPEDKSSNEWRYWKLAHMKAALTGTDEAAANEATAYAAHLIGVALSHDPGDLIPLLPYLIINWQKSKGGAS